ncbi:hypothetical protein ACLM5H_11370 [Fredinandcohnia humi]
MKKFIASAVAFGIASGLIFTPSLKAEAATFQEAEKMVKTAEQHAGALKWQISVEFTNEVKYPDMKVFNLTKDNYVKAKKAVATLSGSQKTELESRLKKNVELHYTRAMGYIDAITSGKKIVDKAAHFHELYASEPTSDVTEQAYHNLSAEIRKQAILLYRVYGKSTRDAILEKYKAPGEKELQEAIYPITTKMLIDELDRLIETSAGQEAINTKADEVITMLFEYVEDDDIYYSLYDMYAETVRKDPVFVATEQEIFDFVDHMNDVYNREDIEGYMNILHPDTPDLDEEKEIIREFFETYDVRFDTIGIELMLLYGEDEALVSHIETEINENRIPYEDIYSEKVYTLQKVNGEWKLVSGYEVYSEPLE